MATFAANSYFGGFCETLRQKGINIPPNSTSAYLQAVSYIDLERLDDLYWSGRATLINHINDVPIYDAVFEGYFHRQGMDALTLGGGEQDTNDSEDDQTTVESILRQDDSQIFELIEGSGTSRQASYGEALITKTLKGTDKAERAFIRKIEILAKKTSPPKVTRRYKPSKNGNKIDLRSSIKRILKTDGEMIKLIWKNRKKRHAPVLILIDVSGSMTMQIRPSLFFAYAMNRALPRCETFCLGTRLTHITEALTVKDVNLAITQISAQVLDWEGGTRLGDGIQSFLSEDRYKSLVRGADIFIISDGLERGSPDVLVKCIRYMAMNGRKFYWLSPLAGHPDYKPETRGMKSIASICETIYPAANLGDIYKTMAKIGGVKGIRSNN